MIHYIESKAPKRKKYSNDKEKINEKLKPNEKGTDKQTYNIKSSVRSKSESLQL